MSDVSTPDPLETIKRDLDGLFGQVLLEKLRALQPGQTIDLGWLVFTGLPGRRFSMSWNGKVHSTWGFPQ